MVQVVLRREQLADEARTRHNQPVAATAGLETVAIGALGVLGVLGTTTSPNGPCEVSGIN